MAFTPEKIRLLFIEDERSAGDAINVLKLDKRVEFDVVHQPNLQAGLKFLRKECSLAESCSVDVILLDLMLPNSQGVETYKKIKSICNFLPIVIISDYEDIACECVKSGAQDFLLKNEITTRVLARSLKYAIERDKNHKALRKSEQKYREIAEITKAGIYEIDFFNNKFTYVNDVMCNLTGWTKEELLNEIKPTDILTEKSLQKFLDRLKALDEGDFIEDNIEYEVKIKDGSTRWALVTATYKENSDGRIVGARVIGIDITSEKLAKEEAKRKEDIIFNELEARIQQWRKELNENILIQQSQIKDVSAEVQSLVPNKIEVF